LERSAELMEKEMQAIISAFSKLEEQASHKVLSLVGKEQVIHRLIAEKAKYEEKFLALNRDREALTNALASYRFQNAKQFDHIRNVDERERNLTQQLTVLELQVLALRTAHDKIQASLLDSISAADILRNQLVVAENKAAAAKLLAEQRLADAQAAASDCAAVSEKLSVATARLARKSFATTDSPSSSFPSSTFQSANNSSADLVDQYKSLLKCPSCRRNFKTHVLNRCMHVFCKSCLDSRIETRQRKCPTCGDAFGVNDVRQIYL
ncbi:E3 ubiquitin-protein ligase BRE1, partial [Zancudomyces culisetae]